MSSAVEREFTFPFSLGGRQFILRAPLKLPLDHPVPELAHRLILAHNLLCTVEEDLCKELNQFVTRELSKYEDELAEHRIKAVKNGDVNVDQLMTNWTNAFTQEVLEYSVVEPPSNDMVFSEVYHSLIHSLSLETLLRLEHTYALAVHRKLEQRDQELLSIENRHRKEMEEAVKLLGITFTDEQINHIAQRHIETAELFESRWASELSSLQEMQRREYRDWVMKLHEETQMSEAVQKRLSHAISGQLGEAREEIDAPIYTRREESFTVHLGAQLKTSHNLRLFSADVLDLCRHRPQTNRGASLSAQRLQMAISLYSNSLNGLVLLVDNRLNSFTGIKREFAKVCEQSTDFHFPNLEQQFEQIEQSVLEAKDWRLRKKTLNLDGDGDRLSLKSYGSAASIDRDDRSVLMQPGDFYITRHSNLSEVHIVFHLISDDSICSSVSEISSRHPIIMGYRNILKSCFRYNIRNITLPLLLVHEMSEEMTIPWCLKRAELVFKCVKGFIMELGLWNSQESCTIQFLVPKTLSDETFASLSNMMPTIFRMSNPVMAKS